jgi:hypothetical protein
MMTSFTGVAGHIVGAVDKAPRQRGTVLSSRTASGFSFA